MTTTTPVTGSATTQPTITDTTVDTNTTTSAVDTNTTSTIASSTTTAAKGCYGAIWDGIKSAFDCTVRFAKNVVYYLTCGYFCKPEGTGTASESTSAESTIESTTDAATLAADLETNLQTIKTDSSHFNKLLNLLEMLNKTETDDIVAVKIREAIAEFPENLRNAIYYGVHTKATDEEGNNVDGADFVANHTRDPAIKEVADEIFAQLPQRIVVQQGDVVRDTAKTWIERANALLNLVRLDLDPKPFAGAHPISGPELDELQLVDEIKVLFLGDNAALSDIFDFRENVLNYLYHKNIADGQADTDGKELFAQVRLNAIVETAIDAVNNGWVAGNPIA